MVGELVRPGQVLRVAEPDYLFGLGTLTIRVTEVGVLTGEWLQVRGVEIRWDGADGPRRDVMVRASALPRHG